MTAIITSPRDCRSCSWGDLRTVHQGVGVPAGNSGIGGELTIPVGVVVCLRTDDEMSPGDTCDHWRYDAHEG